MLFSFASIDEESRHFVPLILAFINEGEHIGLPVRISYVVFLLILPPPPAAMPHVTFWCTVSCIANLTVQRKIRACPAEMRRRQKVIAR